MKVSIETISPETAETMLGHNLKNRHVQQGTVGRYASLMQRGLWRVDGAPIRFSTEGRLLDGQHRLMAIIESGQTVEALIVRGLDDVSQETMDTGRKRSLSGALSMRGAASATELAALLGVATRWDQGARGASLTSGAGTEIPDAIEYYESHLDECARAVRVGHSLRVTGGAPGRMVMLAALLFYRISEDDAEGFFGRISSGVGLASDSAILHLRNACFTPSSGKLITRPEHHLALIIKAWNAYRTGAGVKLLMFRPGGVNPEKFPEPH